MKKSDLQNGMIVECENGYEDLRFENHEVRISDSLTMDKLKAIYQQCKELGWLEE